MDLSIGLSLESPTRTTEVASNSSSASPLSEGEAGAATCFAERTVTMTSDVIASLSDASPVPDSSNAAELKKIESHEVEKISQWQQFKANNQQLFDREKELFDNVTKQVDCYKKIKAELDQLNAGFQGKARLEKIINTLGVVYDQSHLEQIREDVLKAKNGRYMGDVTRILIAWAHYHLDQLSILLASFANDSRSFLYGKVSECSLLIEVVQELSLDLGPVDLAAEVLSEFSRYERGARHHRRNFQSLLSNMQLMDMFSPVVQYETQHVEPVAANPGQHAEEDSEAVFLNVATATTGLDHAQTAMRILWNKNFVSAKYFGKKYSEIFSPKEGIGGFMVTKGLARVFDGFCQHHAIARVIHLSAGTGVLQAAMKSIGSDVAVTSLDTYSGGDVLKLQDGQRQMVFFDEFDREGVVVEEYGKYLNAHRGLISSDSCLLVTFPNIQDKSSRQLKKALQCWGILGGGLVIVLSEVNDKNLIYDNLFTNGGLLKKDSDISLPPELIRTIPHVTPEIFTIERNL